MPAECSAARPVPVTALSDADLADALERAIERQSDEAFALADEYERRLDSGPGTDPRAQAKLDAEVARLWAARGRFDDAAAALHRSIDVYTRLGETVLAMHSLGRLGLELAGRDGPAGLALLNASLGRLTEHGDDRDRAIAKVRLGRAHRVWLHNGQAERWFANARAQAAAAGDHGVAAVALWNLAELRREDNEREAAALLTEALAESTRSADPVPRIPSKTDSPHTTLADALALR